PVDGELLRLVLRPAATFARPNGLFIAHFGWPRSRVAKAMRYYLMSIGLIVPLIMALLPGAVFATPRRLPTVWRWGR
ncbi:hypothetical protein FK513_28660, partial [Klebsiella pneumoniae]|nr:hypothetical protein [Klebsiella pneumoniae]